MAVFPSAERIVPELQHVEVDDIFPITPKAKDTFVVRVVEPERALVIGDAAGGMSWAFALEPVNLNGTRLITRVRATYDSLTAGLFLKVVWHPTRFAMERRQLLNLKRLGRREHDDAWAAKHPCVGARVGGCSSSSVVSRSRRSTGSRSGAGSAGGARHLRNLSA